MAQPNRTKTALLGFLSWGPMSGYDLGQRIPGSIGNFWSEGYGRIYPMLAQLAKEGLASRNETRTPGGRSRNVFAITDSGRQVLLDWLQQPTVTRPPRNERLLKLFFSARIDPSVSREHVEAFREEVRAERRDYAEIRERIESLEDPPRDQRFWLMTLRYGELEREAQQRWCEEVLEELRSLEDAPDTGRPA